MPNHRDCFGSRKPRLLNFRSWQEIQEVNQQQKGNTMSFPRKQNCRTSSVKYQESGDEQSKHLWAQRDIPELSLTDGAGLETASPAKVRLAAELDGRATAQPSTPGTSCQAKLTPWPTNCAHQWPAGEKQAGKFCNLNSKLTRSGFVQVHQLFLHRSALNHWQSSLLCWRWILKSVQVQCTVPAPEILPAPSQMVLWAFISPTLQTKQRLQLSRASQERPRAPGTHNSDRKALEAPFN